MSFHAELPVRTMDVLAMKGTEAGISAEIDTLPSVSMGASRSSR
jgi:hypothetical protein